MNNEPKIDRLDNKMYLDLDGFKEINDTFRHQCGDKLLIEVVQ